MNNQEKKITKVTIEFPNGNKKTFNVLSMVGAFALDEQIEGAKMGAFATGKMGLADLMGLSTGVFEALSMEFLNRGLSPQDVESILSGYIPHAVQSATVREIDAQMAILENPESLIQAIERLMRM